MGRGIISHHTEYVQVCISNLLQPTESVNWRYIISQDDEAEMIWPFTVFIKFQKSPK